MSAIDQEYWVRAIETYKAPDEWPRVPVLHSKYVPAGERVASLPLPETLERCYGYDAHFQPCMGNRRLSSAHLGARPIVMIARFFDCDGPEHPKPPTDDWRRQERAKVERLCSDIGLAFYYETRGGYRFGHLCDPFNIRSQKDADDWSTDYFLELCWLRRVYGIRADKNCADFQRLYRLPFVVRDGVAQRLFTMFDPYFLPHYTHKPTEADEETLAECAREECIAKGLPPEPPPHNKILPFCRVGHSSGLRRAKAYAAAMPPAISEAGGHDAALRVAIAAHVKFGLDFEGTMQVLRHYNATACFPPWTEKELAHKARSAMASRIAKGEP